MLMKILCALLIACLAMAEPAAAATLYRWKDASGTIRYGYQPPSGVEVEPAEEERRELYGEKAPPVKCRDLAEQHLKLIDRELERVKALRAGLGPEYEITPATRQELILDLLAHRAALITGRTAAEFRTPTRDEIERDKSRLQGENTKLRNELKSQEATLDAQQNRLNQARREVNSVRRLLYPWGPGYYPWPAGVPYPIHR
jgi:hypothetical protein